MPACWWNFFISEKKIKGTFDYVIITWSIIRLHEAWWVKTKEATGVVGWRISVSTSVHIAPGVTLTMWYKSMNVSYFVVSRTLVFHRWDWYHKQIQITTNTTWFIIDQSTLYRSYYTKTLSIEYPMNAIIEVAIKLICIVSHILNYEGSDD